MPELDRDLKGRDREYAAALHPRSSRGPRRLNFRQLPRLAGLRMRDGPPGPLGLALDSAGSACSAAVAAGGKVLASQSIDALHGQAEKLVPMVDTVMRQAGIPPAALDLVVTTVGPGSFTGIRAGIAAARGIALAANARLVGVTSFDAVAACSAGPGYEYSSFLFGRTRKPASGSLCTAVRSAGGIGLESQLRVTPAALAKW